MAAATQDLFKKPTKIMAFSCSKLFSCFFGGWGNAARIELQTLLDVLTEKVLPGDRAQKRMILFF